MSFEVGDRVKIANFSKTGAVHDGMKGEIVRTDGGRHKTFVVKFDDKDAGYANVIEEYLELDEPRVIIRIDGPTGFTETLDEKSAIALVAIGVLFHNQTGLYDDHIAKIYNKYEEVYTVTDNRTSAKSLEEQYPRD